MKTPAKTPEKIEPLTREYLALIHGKQQRATVEATGPATPEVTPEVTTEVTTAQPESRSQLRPESQRGIPPVTPHVAVIGMAGELASSDLLCVSDCEAALTTLNHESGPSE